MTSDVSREPNKWHRIGVILSLVGLGLSLVALVLIGDNLPANWHVVTRRSDRPEQVIEAAAHLEKEMAALQAEIDLRAGELQFAAVRASRKANESRGGIGESGGPEPENAARLAELAPEWDRAALAIHEIIQRRALATAQPPFAAEPVPAPAAEHAPGPEPGPAPATAADTH